VLKVFSLPVLGFTALLALSDAHGEQAGAGQVPQGADTSQVRCEIVPPLPGSERAPGDREREQAYCAIDFSSKSLAVCPKTWSTSPAALVYDLVGTAWENKAGQFESEVCAIGGHARDKASSELAVFKNSLNGRETSGTYAPASLLYYHFSRFLQTRVQVPVAVIAEFPVTDYLQRVVAPGLAFSGSSRQKMLHAGWLEMQQALESPESYGHRASLLTGDGQHLWGVMLMFAGKRHGAEINGTRASGWGDGQNRDFQRTAPFLALRVDQPLAQAIASAIDEARQDPAMAKDLPADIEPRQVAWWMGEIAEIVVLDTILGQQDRVGNIDYQWRWLWQEDGLQMSSSRPPQGIDAYRLKVSWLNDNDAGVYSGYANYASRTAMLEGWFHMDPGLYRRLQDLALDFEGNGPAAQALRSNYRLPPREADAIVRRTLEVAAALQKRCQAGQLRMDLAVGNALAPAAAPEPEPACKQ
jgi:hypothetical protein